MTLERKYLSVSDLATITGMSKTGIYGLVKRGLIPHIKLGQRVLIPVQYLHDLDAAIPQAVTPKP